MSQPNQSGPSGQQISDSPIFKKILGRAEDYLKKPLRVKGLLNDAYTKAAAKKDIGQIAAEVWENFQLLFRMIGAAVSGKYHGIPTRTVLGGIAVILYFMSPIDAIPDFFPVIGLLDDAALLAWFASSIKDEMDSFEAWERTEGQTTAGGAENGHIALMPMPAAADAGTPNHHQPIPAADRDTSVRTYTTDGTRVPSSGADRSGGDPGGNVR